MGKRKTEWRYDLCLSFAGEDRKYVAKLAEILTASGVRIFYDEYEEAELWGKDLYSHLDEVYQNTARYCVVFISKHYARKLWTNHERKSAQARAFKASEEYILPARFDDTKIEGVRDTVGFIDLKKINPAQLSKIILKKLGPRQRVNYFPPVPDRLFQYLHIKSSKKQAQASIAAYKFFETLKRLTKAERRLIFAIFDHGCPGEMPENIHIAMELLRRIVKISPTKIIKMLSVLEPLGFYCAIRTGDEKHAEVLLGSRLIKSTIR
jgi:hypothetical protein